MKKLLLILLSFSSGISMARPKQIPLLPPRDFASARPAPTLRTTVTEKQQTEGFGVSLGMLGKEDQTSGDLGIFQVLVGGRFSYQMEPLTNIVTRFSLGYFYKNQNVGNVGITQHNFEAGALAEYLILRSRTINLGLGISNRVDYLVSKISIRNVSGSTPTEFQYRVGPEFSLLIDVGVGVSLLTQAEGTMSVKANSRKQVALTQGIVFQW